MSVVFRNAQEADVAGIVALLADDVLGAEREIVADPPPPAYVESFRAIDASPNDRIIVAERDGMLAGCAQLTVLNGLSRQGARRGQIESVRVASAFRGEGVGEQLIRHLIDEARAAGCRLVQLTSSVSRTDARRFYERIGFEATHVGMKLDL